MGPGLESITFTGSLSTFICPCPWLALHPSWKVACYGIGMPCHDTSSLHLPCYVALPLIGTHPLGRAGVQEWSGSALLLCCGVCLCMSFLKVYVYLIPEAYGVRPIFLFSGSSYPLFGSIRVSFRYLVPARLLVDHAFLHSICSGLCQPFSRYPGVLVGRHLTPRRRAVCCKRILSVQKCEGLWRCWYVTPCTSTISHYCPD